MAEINSGVRRLLTIPQFYEFVQNLMGAKRNRSNFVRDVVKPYPGMRILDVGCGTGKLVEHLPEAVSYVGYEPNDSYVSRGQALYGLRADIRLGFFDEQAAASHAPFDLAIVSAVLHHLDDEQGSELFRLLRSALKANGQVITYDNVYVDGQNPVARWLISLDRGRNVRTPEGYEALARPYFSNVSGIVTHKAMIPYTYWTMRCSNPS